MNTPNDSDMPENEILWDCSGPDYAMPETVKEPIPFDLAMRNLPTNDEGENFYAEMMEDIARLQAIRRGEDAGVTAEIANNPWLTKELIVSYLECSEQILLDAGFALPQ